MKNIFSKEIDIVVYKNQLLMHTKWCVETVIDFDGSLFFGVVAAIIWTERISNGREVNSNKVNPRFSIYSPCNKVQGTQQSTFSVCSVVNGFYLVELNAQLFNTTKCILLDSLLQDDTAGLLYGSYYFRMISEKIGYEFTDRNACPLGSDTFKKS